MFLAKKVSNLLTLLRMRKICKTCGNSYEVSSTNLAYYEKISPEFAGKKFPISPPTLCPDCRQQRRASHLNELKLYKRPCDFTGKMMISNFSPQNPHKVYNQGSWYSDAWDPLEYGRDFDFSRPFFDQYKELCDAVPLPALFTAYQYDENSDYTNYAGKNKNCYLIFDSDENQDCYYSYSLNGSRNCMDCFRLRGGELCYECVDCLQCYNCAYLQESVNCRDSAFLYSCIGCSNCLMCVNLRNKEYHIDNKPVTKEEFETFRAMLSSRSRLQSAKAHFEKLKLQHPHKYLYGVQNESVSGDYLTQCKNANQCFDGVGLWDCAYMYRTFYPCKDSMDCEAAGGDSRLYECSCIGYNANNVLFSSNSLDQLSDILYSSYCFHCQNLFGCVGLRSKKYCVFNKQYSKQEYEQLVARIIDHMQKTSEWGEFFPSSLSPFAYNETLAQDYYPLSKDEVLQRKQRWLEEGETQDQYMGPVVAVPDDSQEADSTMPDKILRCETTGKLFKIIPQELAFLKDRQLPLPTKCFEQRHRERLVLRNPRKLWDRNCGNCKKSIETTYAPDRPEIVYCEECYLQHIH